MDEDKKVEAERILSGVAPEAYSPPSDDVDWGVWADTIEFRLSRQGQIVAGMAIGLGATLLLVGLQGKVVVNLAKGQRLVVDAINNIHSVMGTTGQGGDTSYAKPTGRIDESKVTPIDNDELLDLREKLDMTNIEEPGVE